MTHRKTHPLLSTTAVHWRRTIRGRNPSPRSCRPVPAGPGRVSVEWDPINSLYIGVCTRCTDHLTTDSLDQVEQWASSHDCDPELAALLAEITHGAAA